MSKVKELSNVIIEVSEDDDVPSSGIRITEETFQNKVYFCVNIWNEPFSEGMYLYFDTKSELLAVFSQIAKDLKREE